MASPVSIALKSSGIAEVKNALGGVKHALIELEKDSVAAVRNASKQRIHILKEEYKEREHLAKRSAAVENRLSRGFGRGSNTRPATTGSGGFGGLGSIANFGAQEMGLGGIMKLAGSAGVAGAAVGTLFMALKGGIDIATTALKAFGSFVLNDIVKPELNLDSKYKQLSAKSAEEGGRGLSAADAKMAADMAFIKYNLPKEEAVKAMGAYGAHGGEGAWKDAPKIMELAAKEALIRGGSAETYATTIAGFRTKGESTDETISKYLAVRRQGDIINVPVEELQQRSKQLKSASIFFGGNSQEKMTAANILMQKASVWTNETPEALTQLRRATSSVIMGKGGQKFKKFMGQDENGQQVISNPMGLIGQILADMKGDPKNLDKMGFKDVRAKSFLMNFTPEFVTFQKQAKGEGLTDPKQVNQRAADLMAESFNKLMRETDTLASINAEAAERMKDSGNKIENGFNQVQQVLTDSFMPSVEKVIDDLAPLFDDLANYLEQNSEVIGENLELLAKGFIVGVQLIGRGVEGMMKIINVLASDPIIGTSFKATAAVLGEGLLGVKIDDKKGVINSLYEGLGNQNVVNDPNDKRTPHEKMMAKAQQKKDNAARGAASLTDLVKIIDENKKTNPTGDGSSPTNIHFDEVNAKSKEAANSLSGFSKGILDATAALSKLNRTKSTADAK